MKYFLGMHATWVEATENERGKGSRDSREHKKESTVFEADTLEDAQKIARGTIAIFWKALPKKREGSFTWQKEDPSVSIRFGEVKDLEYQDLLTTDKQSDAA